MSRLAAPLWHISIGAKLAIMPVVALAGFAVYFLFSVVVTRSSELSLSGFSEQTLPVFSLVGEANIGSIEVQSLFIQAIGDRDEFLIEDATERAVIARAAISTIAEKDAHYASRIKTILELWDGYVAKSRIAVNQLIAGNADMQSFQTLAQEKQQAYEAVRESLRALETDSMEDFEAALVAARQRAANSLTLGIALAIALAVVLLAIMALITYAIGYPIDQLRHAIAEVSRGNLRVEVDVKGRDIIAVMCSDFHSLIDSMRSAIGETNSVLSAVARGDFSCRVKAELQGDLAELRRGVNASADSVQRTMNALDAVMDALARGDFSARMGESVESSSRAKVDRAMGLLQSALSALVTTMSAAAGGDFGHRIEIELPGDLNVLKQSVNRSLSALARAFEEIQATTRALSNGDLTHRATGHFSGALGEVTDALNSALDRVAEVLRNVRLAADEVSFGAGEIAKGNADLSERTERQATALQQSAAEIARLVESSRAAADNTRQTSEITRQASDQACAGAELVKRTEQAMVGITEMSARIADIVSFIDSVSSQTNLLALNAAMEAARAGAQGRGFAVVASEIRALAKRTGASANDIRILIGSTGERIEEGSRLVAQSGRTLSRIAESSERIAQLADASASSVEAQTVALARIDSAIGNLTSTNQQNHALVEEVATSSASLSKQSGRLRDNVSRFCLDAATFSGFQPKKNPG